MRILVVDDDLAVRRSIDRALRLEGYDVVTVPSGGEALEALAQAPPDALVLDLGLPDLDGLTVCRRMRSAGDDTPVLMLTARDAVDDRVQGLDAGADDYLVKPFALAELLARLRALLRRRFEGEGGLLRVGDLTPRTSPPARGSAASAPSRSPASSSTSSRCSCATRARCSPARCCSTGCGASTSTRGPTRSPSTSATCAASSRRVASPAASRRCAAWATCCGTRDLPHPARSWRPPSPSCVAVLAASLAAFLVARNTLLDAADNSLTTAAQKILAGEEIGSTTATLGQVIDTTGAVVSGGGLPVTGQVRLVAVNLAPAFFTTVDVDGNEMREYVEHLPAGTTGQRGVLVDGGALQIATLLNVELGAQEAGRYCSAPSPSVGVLLAVVLGWLVARTALVPLNSLTDTVEDLAETTDVSRRLSPGGHDELGRLRRTFNRLLEALESSRRAQSQLVLDASHELRTPLTSLRTNLEVIRRVDELSDEDRSVLVDDVLVQLQELTDIVGDLAELARGDQRPGAREPLRLDLLVQRRRRRAEHARARQGRDVRPRRPSPAGSRATPTAWAAPWATCSTTRASGARRASRCRSSAATAPSSCTTTVRASPRRTCRTSSTASTARRPPAGCPGRASAWPSWRRWSRPRAGPSWPRTTPAGGARMSLRLPTVTGPGPTAPAGPDDTTANDRA